MRLMVMARLCLLFAALKVALAVRLNVTAIGSHNGTSRFECWELDTPFTSSNQAGLVDTKTTVLGDVSRMTYNVIPAGFDSGFHPAPANQWVLLINGLTIITLPDTTSTTITTAGGELGLLFATDTADVSEQGHGSLFPGVTESIVLQIRTAHDEIPKHRVLNPNRPCIADEFTGLRAWAVGF